MTGVMPSALDSAVSATLARLDAAANRGGAVAPFRPFSHHLGGGSPRVALRLGAGELPALAECLAASREGVEGGPPPLRRARPRARASVPPTPCGLDGPPIGADPPRDEGAARMAVAAPGAARGAGAAVESAQFRA
jgi:hypothetical protein